MEDFEIFLFMDNWTAEAAFHKGTSSSKPLFDLVLCLHLIQLHHELFVHVVHVVGTRMRSQGMDGLSQGYLMSGVMNGSAMLSFVPLHLSVLDQKPRLGPWVNYWLPTGCYEWVAPFEWYTKAHQLGIHL